MAMKHLVEKECGGSNPLMNITGHFTQDKARQQDPVRRLQWKVEERPIYERHEDELVEEYLRGPDYNAVPQTFQMEALLNEMRRIDQYTDDHHLQPAYQDIKSEAWASEYLESNPDQELSHRYLSAEADSWLKEYGNENEGPVNEEASVKKKVYHDQWAHEYLDNAISSTKPKIDKPGILEKTAKEILANVADEEILNTEFMKTVKSLSEGSTLGDLNATTSDKVSDWVEEYEKDVHGRDADIEAQKWINEYSLSENEIDYWQKMQQEWDEMANQDVDNEHPWLRQYADDVKKEYVFEEENPFKDHPNAFEEGLIKLKEGDLISAILLFEEAVRIDANHAEAWQYLGTSQAENEREALAISALSRCCELQPDNLTARMSLAVSYTNESLQLQACNSLKEWLRHHPRYKTLVPDEASAKSTRVTSLMSTDEFNEIHDLYIDAAQLFPNGDIDADVQVGLGVLFNLSGDYDKAVDCFQSGLKARPSDPYIWNKLGATLANSGRSEEGVEAYRNALQLNPAFNRARYNLGISCLNLGAHAEAVQHFLTALNLQRKGENPSGVITTMSDNIWSTLRMTISLLGRTDLHPYVQTRDLEKLNQEFNMQ